MERPLLLKFFCAVGDLVIASLPAPNANPYKVTAMLFAVHRSRHAPATLSRAVAATRLMSSSEGLVTSHRSPTQSMLRLCGPPTKLHTPISLAHFSSNPKPTNTSRREDNWNNYFADLELYRQKTGNCEVPMNYEANPALARWVEHQRYQYRLLKEGKQSSMKPDRIRALEDIDFTWSVYELRWEEGFELFRKFVEKHGHSNVPPSELELVSFIKKRRFYKRQLEARGEEPTPLMKERFAMLDALGFIWDGHGAAWMDKFKQLQEYHRNNGNCLVPTNLGALGKWVDEQRQSYKRRLKGKQSSITEERINMLESEGFVWDAAEAIWFEKYKEVRDFYITNGHIRIPAKKRNDLNRWCRYQRKLYRMHLNGERTSLTGERIKLLAEISLVSADAIDQNPYNNN